MARRSARKSTRKSSPRSSRQAAAAAPAGDREKIIAAFLRLLADKPDVKLTRGDYVKIVEKLQRDFLAGVARNLRMRALAELPQNAQLRTSQVIRSNNAFSRYFCHITRFLKLNRSERRLF